LAAHSQAPVLVAAHATSAAVTTTATIPATTIPVATSEVTATTSAAASAIIEVAVAWRSAGILFNIDELTRNPRISQTIQDRWIHLLWQIYQGVTNCNSNAAKVLRRQSTFVGDSANNGAWTHVLTLTHV